MQPWAALIVTGAKDLENRSWPTRFRGPVLIHAGKMLDQDAADALASGVHPVKLGYWPGAAGRLLDLAPRGGIVGVAEIVDCVSDSTSEWFVGRYGFVLRNARPLPFMPMRGRLGFFPAEYAAPALAHQGAQP
jgi:hypothetical protein